MAKIKFMPIQNPIDKLYADVTGMPFPVSAAVTGEDEPVPPVPTPTTLNEWVIPTEVINFLIAQSGGHREYPSNPTIWEGDAIDFICGIDFTPVGCEKSIKVDGVSVGVRENEEIAAFDGYQFTEEIAAIVQQYIGVDISDYIGKYVVVFATDGTGLLPHSVDVQCFLTKDDVTYNTETYEASWEDPENPEEQVE